MLNLLYEHFCGKIENGPLWNPSWSRKKKSIVRYEFLEKIIITPVTFLLGPLKIYLIMMFLIGLMSYGFLKIKMKSIMRHFLPDILTRKHHCWLKWILILSPQNSFLIYFGVDSFPQENILKLPLFFEWTYCYLFLGTLKAFKEKKNGLGHIP